MVGVPGRSKGCHTCRRRKKKCDLQQPICGNCTRGKFVCAGYDRDMIVVQVNPQGKGTYQQQPQKTTVLRLDRVIHHTSPADIRNKNFDRTTFEIECFAWFRHLLTPQVSSDGGLHTTPSFVDEWWTQIYHQAPRSDLVRCSILSASAFQVGHAKCDSSLRNRGVELYSEAIRLMSRALAPSRLARGDTVAFDLEMAGFSLALYEYLRQETPNIDEQDPPAARFRKYYDRDEIRFSSRQKGHLAGMMNLMQSQKPESYSAPSRHQIFLQLRQFWLPLCIENRQGTFLANREWLTQPWQGLPKSYYDTVLDTITPIPGILEAWDELKAAAPGRETEERASTLEGQCRDIAIAFEEWHHILSTACSSFTAEEARALRALIDGNALEDLPDILIRYGTWYLYTWMMHWAARIPVYCTALNIYLHFPPTSTERIITPPVSIGTYCLSVARSVKHFLQPGRTGMMGEMTMRMPVSFVQKVLANPELRSSGDPKMAEAENILKSVGRTELTLALRGTVEKPSTNTPGVKGMLQ